ncbi:hypothetical protein Y900_008030 [Mycolicibacterium aromaticivorans JS19b1 = JCM 16368]|uniref:DUF5642 domain-containing protein n=1 Tax=Mycolicibacterium aromaticivorans JS19b1 = JCM 16368 TaxID=1440774 RepID=A0A064CJJ4_9MYCO|nr:DUF5642 family protein [Mycolicibacterium aromaticivorans]KDE98898.1 hypothetical protein Y900_008030 [Mycolicibacterium aromaticivorans JS19b1 = JCM 16368]
MRRLIVCLTTTLCLATGLGLAACAQRTPAPPTSSSSTAATGAGAINPANIKRIRSSLPAGYEIADLAGPVSAAGLWGFGSGWTAAPPQCAALADPAPADPGARGYSASGAGGTVYVVVAMPAQPAPDDAVIGDCARWTMTFAHTTGDVTLAPPSEAPGIDGARTVAMTVITRTVVESGTETDGQAVTAQAYLDGHVVYVTLVTDPGSPHPALDSHFVDGLLVATVAALRG